MPNLKCFFSIWINNSSCKEWEIVCFVVDVKQEWTIHNEFNFLAHKLSPENLHLMTFSTFLNIFYHLEKQKLKQSKFKEKEPVLVKQLENPHIFKSLGRWMLRQTWLIL